MSHPPHSGPPRSGATPFNALKHGLYARTVVLPGEDRDAYDELVTNLRADLQPVGRLENGLLDRAADLWWRLGRASAIEAGLLNPSWSTDHRAELRLSGGGPVVDCFRVALDDTAILDQLGRYEGRLERALARTLRLFEDAQRIRLRGRGMGRDGVANASHSQSGHFPTVENKG